MTEITSQLSAALADRYRIERAERELVWVENWFEELRAKMKR